MAIRYQAYTPDGQRVSGSLAVDSAREAEEQLWRSNLIVTSLKPEVPRGAQLRHYLYSQLPTIFRPRAQELVGFTRELASLLQAGIPIHEALVLLQDRIVNLLLKDAVAQIASDLQQGSSVSAAIAKHPTVFPAIYTRLLTVGEETGTLERALTQLADYLEKQAALTRRVGSALRYPALVGLVGMGAAYFMFSYTLPALTGLLKEFGGQLPASARVLIASQTFLATYGKWLLVGIATLAAGLWLYLRTRAGQRQRDVLLLRLPQVGRVLRLTAMFRFASTTHTMLAAGLPLVEALELTARATGSTPVREAVLRTREAILQGHPFSQALRQQPLFPAIVAQMAAVGEQSGTLSQNLNTLATFFDQEAERAVAGLTAIIEPAMILAAGGVVGFMAVAVASALYGTLRQIQ